MISLKKVYLSVQSPVPVLLIMLRPKKNHHRAHNSKFENEIPTTTAIKYYERMHTLLKREVLY